MSRIAEICCHRKGQLLTPLSCRGPDAKQYKPSRFIEVDRRTGARSYKVYGNFQFHSFNGG